MSLRRIDALDLTGVVVNVAVAANDDGDYALDVRVQHPARPEDVEVGAWIYWFEDERWEDNLPFVYDDPSRTSAPWTVPFAERVLVAYWNGEDVDTRPVMTAPALNAGDPARGARR